MLNIYEKIVEAQKSKRTFVIVTIVRTSGSSPRDVGAKMMVYSDGTIVGTIGGGNFEKLVIDDSLELFKSNDNHLLKKYRFSQTGPDATGMCCGGEAEVFMEVSSKPDQLIIFGGGHIGRELVKLACGLNFSITVIDDRQEILNSYQLPVKTVLTDSEYNTNFPPIENKCVIVIVTRSHKCDRAILAKVVKREWAYIGMIGSKAKVIKVFSSLQESGVDKSLLAKVHAPIGIDIGAEGPYEIAIAIIAEIIAARKKTPRKSQ